MGPPIKKTTTEVKNNDYIDMNDIMAEVNAVTPASDRTDYGSEVPENVIIAHKIHRHIQTMDGRGLTSTWYADPILNILEITISDVRKRKKRVMKFNLKKEDKLKQLNKILTSLESNKGDYIRMWHFGASILKVIFDDIYASKYIDNMTGDIISPVSRFRKPLAAVFSMSGAATVIAILGLLL